MSFCSRFRCLLGPFWPPFWVLLGAQPKSAQVRPKRPQDRPKMASRPAKMTFFMPNRDFSKIVKILRKINGFGSPSRPKIAPRWPQARSRWPKIGPRRLQDGLETILKRIFSLLNIDFDLKLFWDRFWLHLGSQNASLWGPFLLPKSTKKIIKNPSAPNVAPRSPNFAPR